MRFLCLFFVVVAGLHGLGAEEESNPAKTPPRQMRLLTVGEEPPFRQEIRDGVRYQLPAPAGSLPPPALAVIALSKDGTEKESGLLRLRIGSISAPVTVPGGAGQLVLRLPDTEAGGEPWQRIQRPESGDFLVVMWRGAENNTWEKPSSFVVSTRLPAEQASLINVAPGPVAVVYDSEKIALPRLKILRRPLPAGKPLGFQVGLPQGNTLQRLVSRSLEQPAGHHSIVVFYRADGERPRSPLGMEVVRLKAERLPGTE